MKNSIGGACVDAGAVAMIKKEIPNHETKPVTKRSTQTACNNRACSASKETNFDSLLMRKMPRGAIHQSMICNLCARRAIVRSSWVTAFWVTAFWIRECWANSV
jgi:hypothetical protein